MKTPDKYTIDQNSLLAPFNHMLKILFYQKKRKNVKNVQHKKRPNDQIKNATVDKLKIVSVSDLVQV